jgi:hypothetical protein
VRRTRIEAGGSDRGRRLRGSGGSDRGWRRRSSPEKDDPVVKERGGASARWAATKIFAEEGRSCCVCVCERESIVWRVRKCKKF